MTRYVLEGEWTGTVSRAATPDEITAEMDRRGAVIEKLETNLRHWREECGKLHSQLVAANERLSCVRRFLATWDTPTDMELDELARLTIVRVRDLEQANEDSKNRIEELLEELAKTTEEEDDHL